MIIYARAHRVLDIILLPTVAETPPKMVAEWFVLNSTDDYG